MKRFLFCIAACLPVLASASSYALSGKVTDKSEKGIAGIWVGLIQAKIATLTASDGSWSFGGASGIASRTASRTAVTRHLVSENGHLQLSFDGKDLSGRNLSGTTALILPTTSGAGAGRTADATTDTLLYVRDGSVLASTVVSSTSFQAGSVVLDTTLLNVGYTLHADTLQVHSNQRDYADIYCAGSVFNIWKGAPSAHEETDILHMTNDGMELGYPNDDESNQKYPLVTKFRRLSGEAGSLIGRFQATGSVYRSLASNVPDSVTKIIAEDSTISATIAVQRGLVYEFTSTSISLIGMNKFNFSRQFLNSWNGFDKVWEYSSYDSSWYDERKHSDSAKYNITVQVVDSSTVRLTGNTTKEVVTITGTPSTNGFDQTYASSNNAHASGTKLAIPTSCPEAVTWYSSFLTANQRTATAARVAGPSATLPKHKKPRWF